MCRLLILELYIVAAAALGDGQPVVARQQRLMRREPDVRDIVASSLLQVKSNLTSVRVHEQRGPTSARCLVVTELANTARHRNQFQAVFHPSWRQMVEDPSPGEYTVDLMAFCEAGACDAMPAECRELQEGESPDPKAPPSCYFERLPESYAESVPYKFGLSLNFMTTTAFAAVAKSYDYVMRSDADAVLLTGLKHWVPEQGSAVGHGYAGTDFTYHRLEQLAKKMGYSHHGVHGMQSTFYIRSGKIAEFSGLLVNLSNHFYEDEFTPTICEEVERLGAKCAWSDWYKLVSTLYATDIAANHLLGEPDFNQVQVSPKLDHCATDCFDAVTYRDNGFLAASPYKAREVAQVHLLSTKHHLGNHFLTANTHEEFCKSARETWPNFQLPHPADWATPDESVNTYFLRVLATSLPKVCAA